MDREVEFGEVVGAIYRAAAEPELWPTALTAAADLVGAVGAQVFLWNKLGHTVPFAAVGRLPEEGNALYVQHYGAIDPRRQALEHRPVGELVLDQDLDGDRLRKSEFYNDFLVPYGVPYVAGSRIVDTPELCVVLGVLRSFPQGPFGSVEADLLRRLLPHFQHAARIHDKLRSLDLCSRAVENALDRLSFGVVIANTNGRVVIVNRAAKEIAAASDGVHIHHGRLTAERAEEAGVIARLIRDAAQSAAHRGGAGGGSLRVPRPSGRQPYVVLVAPLESETAPSLTSESPAVLILISDLEQGPKVLGRRLVDLFGLSPAEACLAVALAEGKRLEEVAEERRVRMPTVRTQMRAVLDKTGTTRQADLVRLIARLPAVRGT